MNGSPIEIISDLSAFEEAKKAYEKIWDAPEMKLYQDNLNFLMTRFEKALQEKNYERLFRLEFLAQDKDRHAALCRGEDLQRRPDAFETLDQLRHLWKITADPKSFNRFYKMTRQAYPDGRAPYDQFQSAVNRLKRQIDVYGVGETSAAQRRYHNTRKRCLDALALEYKRRVERMLKRMDKGLSR